MSLFSRKVMLNILPQEIEVVEELIVFQPKCLARVGS
jgi:hypothetical protein